MCQIFYLGIFTILTLAGFSSVWVQYLAVPIFGVLFCLLVQADRGMILFLYVYPRLSACDRAAAFLYL